MEIEIVDAIESRVLNREAMLLKPVLSYPAIYVRKARYKMVKKEYRKQVFTLKTPTHTYFYTGMIPRIQKYCQERDIPITFKGEASNYAYARPSITGITFRPDQLDLIEKACKAGRGIIKAPTGTGKTICAMGVVSCFPDAKILILAHTISIVQQTVDEFKKWGFTSIKTIGGENKNRDIDSFRIVVSTMQSFSKISPEEFQSEFDVVIVDEAHHVARENGLYVKILSRLLAPVRLGFTATLPTENEALFTMEGLLGPVVGEQTIDEASGLEILAHPKIKLLKSQYSVKVNQLKPYKSVYQEGIVLNRSRNRQILMTADEHIKKGETVLIMVSRIEHGQELLFLSRNLFKFPIEFVQGATDSESRDKTKKLLIDKKISCVIATTVWREGINIPSLNVVINACGGKSEIMTLQAIGRGLRRTEEKTEATIVDFFDPSHHFLISHFGERITLYMEQGWL